MDHILVEGVCVSPDHYIGGERITSSATFEDISPNYSCGLRTGWQIAICDLCRRGHRAGGGNSAAPVL